MPYPANVFRVIIASPSDVEEERKVARKAIYKWNDLHSEEKKLVLLPVGWETHSSPETGERTQETINKQILKNADLLIGIIWTRIGTPTGKAESGTVEEFEEHIKAGKPAMVYFSNKHINPQQIDNEQYEKVKAFKAKYKGQSIYHEFSTTAEFENKLYEHLVLQINGNDYFQKQTELLGINNNPIAINLSEEAKQLLIESSSSQGGGQIFRFGTLQGLVIKTSRKTFCDEQGDARLEAIWEDAVKELEENELIEDKGYKREVFSVTRKGYEVADSLIASDYKGKLGL